MLRDLKDHGYTTKTHNKLSLSAMQPAAVLTHETYTKETIQGTELYGNNG